MYIITKNNGRLVLREDGTFSRFIDDAKEFHAIEEVMENHILLDGEQINEIFDGNKDDVWIMG